MRRGLVQLLAAVVLLTAGCDDGGGPGDDENASLTALPGVRDAFVGQKETEDGVFSRVVIVDAEPDATVEEVTDVLEAMGALDPEQTRLYLGAGNLDLGQPVDDPPPMFSSGPDPEVDAAQSAAFLVDGSALPGVRAEVGAYNARLALWVSSSDPDDVAETARAALADPDLAPASPLRVTGPAGSISGAPLTGATVDAYATLAAATTDPVFSQRGYGGTKGPVGINVEFVLPDDVTAAQLTPQAYADTLVPALHAELDLLRGAPPQSGVMLRRDVANTGGDVLVEVVLGADGVPVVTPDPQGRGWDALATDYLSGG